MLESTWRPYVKLRFQWSDKRHDKGPHDVGTCTTDDKLFAFHTELRLPNTTVSTTEESGDV